MAHSRCVASRQRLHQHELVPALHLATAAGHQAAVAQHGAVAAQHALRRVRLNHISHTNFHACGCGAGCGVLEVKDSQCRRACSGGQSGRQRGMHDRVSIRRVQAAAEEAAARRHSSSSSSRAAVNKAHGAQAGNGGGGSGRRLQAAPAGAMTAAPKYLFPPAAPAKQGGH